MMTTTTQATTSSDCPVTRFQILRHLPFLRVSLVLLAALLLTEAASGIDALIPAGRQDRYTTTDKDWLTHQDFDFAYNGLGSDGWVFFGDFDGIAESGQPFTHRVQRIPSYISTIDPGANFDSVADEFNTDGPGYGIIDNPVTLDGSDGRSGAIIATGGIAGSNLSVLNFTVSDSLFKTVRVGIFSGNEQSADGRWDPTSITLTHDWTGASLTVGNHAANPLPIVPDATTPNNVGWVFFDITQSGSYTITATKRLNSHGVAIGGLTFDSRALVPNPGPYVVTTDADLGVGSLSWAIYQANNHINSVADPVDTIVFDSAFFSTPRTINLHSTLSLVDSSGPTIIAGPGQDLLTISGNNAFRVFLVQALYISQPLGPPGPPAVEVEIDDLTIADGLCGTNGSVTPRGAGIHNTGLLTLNRVTVRDNVSILVEYSGDSWAGGIFNYGILTINDSTIANNLSRCVTDTLGADAYGGGIYNWTGATLTLNNSVVTANRAEALNTAGAVTAFNNAWGGGIGNQGSATLDQTIVSNNVADIRTQQGLSSAYSFGGGIVNFESMTIRNGCVVSGNSATASTEALEDAQASGGGVYSYGDLLTVTDTVIQDNTAAISDTFTGFAMGGGMHASGTFRRCTITGNTVSAQGNQVIAWGGGAFTGSATFVNSSVSRNLATVVSTNPGKVSQSLGGGIYVGGSLNLLNSTVAGNRSLFGGPLGVAHGGALYLESGGALALANSTVVANTAASEATTYGEAHGGGIYGPFTAGNTILTGNGVSVSAAGGIGVGPNLEGSVTSQGHNLIGDTAGGSGFVGSDLTSVAALDVFADRDSSGTIDADDLVTSGTSSGTFPLKLGSTAHNAGDNALIPTDPDTSLPITTDQRGTGFPRIYAGGTVDIGAYETGFTPTPNLHVFQGFVDDDFLNLANWNSLGTPTPAAMASGDTYLILAPAVLDGAAVLAGTLEIDPSVSVTVGSAGSLELDAGAVATGGGTLAIEGALLATGSDTLSVACRLELNNTSPGGRVLEIEPGSQLQNTGIVSYSAGEALVNGSWRHGQAPLQALPAATVTGSGLVNGNLQIWGRLEPGPESGTGDLNVQGYLHCIPGCTVEIEVTGSAPGAFDRVLVSGRFELAGNLVVDFSDQPSADPGSYTFLTYDSYFSSFTTRTPVDLGPGFNFGYTTAAPGQFTVTPLAPQFYTFNGAVDTDFLDPANWTGGDPAVLLPATPRAVDTYIVGADAVLSGAAAVNGVLGVDTGASLTVDGGGALTLKNGGQLTAGLGGTLTIDGSLLFEGDGTGTYFVISGILNGSAPVSIPAGCGMFMGGGNLAGTITIAAPLDLSFDATVSGSLTFLDTSVTGAAPFIVTGKLTVAGTGTTSVAGPLVLNHPGNRVLEIAPGAELENSGAITLEAGEAMVRGTWRLNQTELVAHAATTLAGDGLVSGGQVSTEGLIKPGPESGYGDLHIDYYLWAREGSVVEIEVGGSGAGQFDRLVLNSMAVYGTLIVDFSDLPVAEVGVYPFVVASGTAAISSASVSLVALDGSRSFDLDPMPSNIHFTISPSTTSYEYWAAAMGLTPGVNDGLSDIAVPGGEPNFLHFAFDTHPLTSGGDEGKSRLRFVDVDVLGTRHLSITLPVRSGALFAGAPSPAATLDGITYSIEGSGDLQSWLLSVSEIAPVDSAGLPPLRDLDGNGTPDWEYRTFILDDDSLPRAFLRGTVQAAP